MIASIVGVVGTLLGIFIGFILERYRDKTIRKREKIEKTITAKRLVKNFLEHEIKNNDKQLRMKRYAMNSQEKDESILTAIQKVYTNISFGDGRKYFSTENWKLILHKVIDLDEETAMIVNKLYHYYEFLANFQGWANDVSEVNLENYFSYEEDYDALIRYLEEV